MSSDVCDFSDLQGILFVTRTVKHNYILPISTVRIQLHVSVLYVDHLQVEIFNLQISYTGCVGYLGCFNSGYHDLELLEVTLTWLRWLPVYFLINFRFRLCGICDG